MPRLIKKIILVLLILCGVAVLVFGPSGGETLPAGFVNVDYWEKWTGFEAEDMKIIVDDFNRTVGRQKHIRVRYISLSNIAQKTLLATAAGDPPDIAGLWDQQVCQWAALDALEPLDERAAARGITAGVYKPGYWKGCCYQGRLWALVSTPAAVALHYNKRIFYENAGKLRAAGLDPARPPRTLTELDRYAAALDQYAPARPDKSGRGPLDRAGFLPAKSWYLNSIVYWFGGKLFDDEHQRLTLTLPENVRAYQWLQNYTLRMGPAAVSQFESGMGQFSSPQNPFILGKLVMEQQGPWMANTIFSLAPDMSQRLVPWPLEQYLPHVLRAFNYDWGVAAFPSDLPDHPELTELTFDVLTIPRGAKHKDEAFEFIAYVQSQPVMEKLCSLHCKNSPLKNVSRQFIRTHPNPYIDVFERISSADNDPPYPSTGLWPQINDELTVVGQEVATLDERYPTPLSALAAAQARLQPKLDKYNETAKARELAIEQGKPR